MDGVALFEGADTSRDISGSIWDDCPMELLRDGRGGVFFRDDFMTLPGGAIPTTEGALGQYAAFSSTGGTITNDVTELGGAWKFLSDDDNEGASIRSGVTPFKLIRTGKGFWFEARIKSSTIADTTTNIFLGLMEDTALTAIVPITALGAMADKNMVIFRRTEVAAHGAKMDTAYKVDGVAAVTVQADAVTLVANTYTKLGMKYIPDRDFGPGGRGTLYFYQDGTRLSSYKLIPTAAGTDFPNDINLGLVFAILNAAGTSPGNASIDWWQAAQLI